MIHSIKPLSIAFGFIITVSMHVHGSQGTYFKKLSESIDSNIQQSLKVGIGELERQRKELQSHLDCLNKLHPNDAQSLPLIEDINSESRVANYIDAWKINRLAAYRAQHQDKEPKLKALVVPYDELFDEAPIQYDTISSWRKDIMSNDPRFMIYNINQFFAKGCHDGKTTKLTEYIIGLNSEEASSEISQLPDNEKETIADSRKAITNNKHFQTVCQFIIDGPYFKEKADFVSALNALGTKQYQNPKSNSSSTTSNFSGITKILAGGGFILAISSLLLYLWKNNPNFFDRTPSSSLHA